MKRIESIKHFLLPVLGLALLGCQSLQKDLFLSVSDEKTYGNLAEIEEAIVTLDGKGADRAGLALARQKISALEGTVADTAFEALLSAWSGRLYLLEGKNNDARREYRRSQNYSPYNIPSRILGSRLERDLSARLSMIDAGLQSEGSLGELLIERGRILFDMDRFSESVAAFDTAFINLGDKPYYEESYSMFRNKAWELRELEKGISGPAVGIARMDEITWKDLIDITKNESDFFRFLTAGREWPTETIFAQLLERSIIPVTQNAALLDWPMARPASSETVLRSGAAWFLWHLYAETRANRGLLTRYSSRFSNTPNARSPVSDIDVWSPFIDSVLGCVESEFMSLPDGKSFFPQEKVKGPEFLSMLRKLK